MSAQYSTSLPFDSSDPPPSYSTAELLEQLLRREDGSTPSPRQKRIAVTHAEAMLAIHLDKQFPPEFAARWAEVRAARFASPVCFTVIAAQRCCQNGKTLNVRKQAALEKQLRPALALYELFCAVADALGYTAEQVEGSACKFQQIMELCQAFRYCARPWEIGSLATAIDFDARVADWYVRAFLWSEEQLTDHVRRQFAAVLGEEYPDGPDALLQWIPRRRLAMLTTAELRFTAFNWKGYHPIVEYLIERKSGPRDRELEDTLACLTGDVVKSLTRPHEGYRNDPHDATVAVWTAIDAIADPLDGYTYGQGLLEWIKSRAAVLLARERRARQRRYADLPPDVAGRDDIPWTRRACTREDLAVEALHLHAVTLGVPEQAQRAWGIWIWKALSDSAQNNDALASIVTLATGEVCSGEALAVARHRLLRSLHAVDEVFNAARAKPPVKLSTFEQVLERVPRDARGRPPRDGSLTRQLDKHLRRTIASAMASAADGEATMVWSSVAHVLVETLDKDPLTEAATTVRNMARVWSDGGGGETGLLERDLVAERFARIGRWLNSDPDRLARLRKRANALNVREILGAAVYLKVIQRLSTNEALNVLPVSDAGSDAGPAGNADLMWRYRCLLDDIGDG